MNLNMPGADETGLIQLTTENKNQFLWSDALFLVLEVKMQNIYLSKVEERAIFSKTQKVEAYQNIQQYN